MITMLLGRIMLQLCCNHMLPPWEVCNRTVQGAGNSTSGHNCVGQSCAVFQAEAHHNIQQRHIEWPTTHTSRVGKKGTLQTAYLTRNGQTRGRKGSSCGNSSVFTGAVRDCMYNLLRMPQQWQRCSVRSRQMEYRGLDAASPKCSAVACNQPFSSVPNWCRTVTSAHFARYPTSAGRSDHRLGVQML